MKYLIDTEPSLVNTASANGVTPLHLAAYFGLHDLLLMLLENQANPDTTAKCVPYGKVFMSENHQ